jgi:hypothetical protein
MGCPAKNEENASLGEFALTRQEQKWVETERLNPVSI